MQLRSGYVIVPITCITMFAGIQFLHSHSINSCLARTQPCVETKTMLVSYATLTCVAVTKHLALSFSQLKLCVTRTQICMARHKVRVYCNEFKLT